MRLSPDIHPDKPVISGDFSIEVDKAVEDWLNRAVEIIRRIDNIYIKNKGVYHPGAKFADVDIVLDNLIAELQSIYEGVGGSGELIFEHTVMAISLSLPTTSPNRNGLLTNLGLILNKRGLVDQVEKMIANDSPIGLNNFHLNLLAEALSEARLGMGQVDRADHLSNKAKQFKTAHRRDLKIDQIIERSI